MSYNGSGTFNINSAGQPVVTGTVITSTAFNALTADLATGLSTALTKDGQTTPTANIPMGTYKITGLGAGTAATDAVRLSQLQNGGTTTYITAAGTDTITGTVTPALTAYATGQQFSFVVAATNTTAVTLNVDGVGAKAVTRTGSVALVAGDMVTGQVVIVEYDGTRFQLINGNSFTNLRASGTLDVTGATTLSSTLAVTGITTVAAGTAALPAIVSTTGTADTGLWFPAADTVAASTAGTERMRIDSSGNVGIGTTSISNKLEVNGTINIANGSSVGWGNQQTTITGSTATNVMQFYTAAAERMRIDASGNVLVGCTAVPSASVEGRRIASGSGATTSSSGSSTSAYSHWTFINGNGSVGSIQTSASATSYNTSSDYRLKTTITPMVGALAKVSALKPVTYKWKVDGSDGQGFIAHELAEVEPGCVTGEKDGVEIYTDVDGNEQTRPKYQGIDTSFLVATLTAAIQELKAIIDTQATRIAALEAK